MHLPEGQLMAQQDFYQEVRPAWRGRTPNQKMFFPLSTGRPDSFRKVPRGTQARRGNQGMLARHRAENLLARLGL
jgi:hypothetical protein